MMMAIRIFGNLDELLSFENYPDLIALRDDGNNDPAVFDIVVTNPPFGSIMKQEVMQMLGRFDLGHKKKSLPLEILGLERSLQFLKPGGKLAIVLPEHLMKGKNGLFVRKWLETVALVKGIFFFPEEAFTPFGAMVKTCLCILQKVGSGARSSEGETTFLCEVENLGYEATGKPKAGSEVEKAVDAFRTKAAWA
jgi:type I restriction enzyme M protein